MPQAANRFTTKSPTRSAISLLSRFQAETRLAYSTPGSQRKRLWALDQSPSSRLELKSASSGVDEQRRCACGGNRHAGADEHDHSEGGHKGVIQRAPDYLVHVFIVDLRNRCRREFVALHKKVR